MADAGTGDFFSQPNEFSRYADPFGHGDLYKGFAGLEREIRKAEVRAMRRGALLMQKKAQATHAYQDETGATRASTFAFVQNFTKDNRKTGNPANNAEDLAEAMNPGHGTSVIRALYGAEEFFFGEKGDPVIILSTGTDYTAALETNYGGQNAFLGPTMDEVGPQVHALIMQYCQSAVQRFDAKQAAAASALSDLGDA